jgi:aminoglycoside phosphotransferase (APT) family kinase protein
MNSVAKLPELAAESPFDVARLRDWMRAHVAGFRGSIDVERLRGGQSNPTYLLRGERHRYVLRRKPTGELLPSAHAVDREYRVVRALANCAVPVARTYALCEDPQVIGSAFYLMDYIDGRIFWDAALPEVAPADRAAIYAETNRVIAALHRVDYSALGLSDYGKAGDYLQRQIARWSRQYRASTLQSIEALDRLIDWLPQHIPDSAGTTLVHGDYRLDNVIFHPREPRILAVIDWELSTLGDPLVDFAYHCMRWRVPAEGLRGLLDRDLRALALPLESDYVAAYCQRVGRTPLPAKEWDYYIVFNMFRLAAILHGVLTRALQGNASNEHALTAGLRARPLAEAAWELARGLSRGATR